jgi:hypothetical protein
MKFNFTQNLHKSIFDKSFAPLSLFALCVFGALPFSSQAQSLAFNRTAATSSVQTGTSFIALNVTDGNQTSRWSSNFTDNEWIYIDLMSVLKISKVVLRWETAAAASYNIQVSKDSKSWTTILSKTGLGTGPRVDINIPASPATGRYVRMQGVKRATPYGYSLYEFEVFSTRSISDPNPGQFIMSHGQSCIVKDTIWAYSILPKVDPNHPAFDNYTLWSIALSKAPASSDGNSWDSCGEIWDNTSGKPQVFMLPENQIPMIAKNYDRYRGSFPGIWYDAGTWYLVYECEGWNVNGDASQGALCTDGSECENWFMNTAGIGLATSTDGYRFVKKGVILKLTPTPDRFEYWNLGTPKLFKKGTMWYLTYTVRSGYNGCVPNGGCPSVKDQICLATGTSLTLGGLTKYAGNPILPATDQTGLSVHGWEQNTTGTRNIIRANGMYYMVYEGAKCATPTSSDFANAGWGWGFAASNDLIHWSWYSGNPIQFFPNGMADDGPMFITASGNTYVYHRGTIWQNGSLNNERNLINFTNYNLNFEAENLQHSYGKSITEADGTKSWGVDGTNAPSTQQIMIYGPYTTSEQQGDNVATFMMKINATNPSSADNVARIDICQTDPNNTSNQTVLETRLVKRSEFPTALNTYSPIKIPFTNANPTFWTEFRVWTVGQKYSIYVDNVTVSNVFHQTWEAENLSHNPPITNNPSVIVGSQVTDSRGTAWQAWHTAGPGVLTYGPYTTAVPVGQNTAAFRLMVDNNTVSEPPILTCEVVSNEVVIGSLQISRPDFRSTYNYQYFLVPFRNSSSVNILQFRIRTTGTSYFREDKVLVYRSDVNDITQ